MGRSYVSEAANSGVNFTYWRSSANVLRRKMAVGTAGSPRPLTDGVESGIIILDDFYTFCHLIAEGGIA